MKDLTTLSKRERDEVAAHFNWLGLAVRNLRPFLTERERHLLNSFVDEFGKRLDAVKILDVQKIEAEKNLWPDTSAERWDSLR